MDSLPGIYHDLFQFLRHPRPAIDAEAQMRLFLEKGQNDHVCALPSADAAAANRS
jgi:hypothetical protein